MKRLFTATCLAATCAVGLAAQSTGTSGTTAQDPQGGGQRGGGGGPRTVTGCLRAGDTAGSYMLTDVMMQGGGRRRCHDNRIGHDGRHDHQRDDRERDNHGRDNHGRHHHGRHHDRHGRRGPRPGWTAIDHADRGLERRSQAARRPQDRSRRDDGGRRRAAGWRRGGYGDGHRHGHDRERDDRERDDRRRRHDGERFGDRHRDRDLGVGRRPGPRRPAQHDGDVDPDGFGKLQLVRGEKRQQRDWRQSFRAGAFLLCCEVQIWRVQCGRARLRSGS
jgi:hypothetical protein